MFKNSINICTHEFTIHFATINTILVAPLNPGVSDLQYTLLLLILLSWYHYFWLLVDLQYTLLLLILRTQVVWVWYWRTFTIHFATINTHYITSILAVPKVFTIHFATINTYFISNNIRYFMFIYNTLCYY